MSELIDAALVRDIRSEMEDPHGASNHVWHLVTWTDGRKTWEPRARLIECTRLLRRHDMRLAKFKQRLHLHLSTPRMRNSSGAMQCKRCQNKPGVVAFRAMIARAGISTVFVCNDVDNEGPPPRFAYLTENIRDVDVPLGIELEGGTRQVQGCHHLDPLAECTRETACECLSTSDGFAYERGMDHLRGDYTSRIIYECNRYCQCSIHCGNRVVQLHSSSHRPVEIFRTQDRGWGVRAKSRILQGDYVGQYVGEIIADKEAEHRGTQADERGDAKYLFDLDAEVRYDLGEKNQFSVDAKHYGNFTRFFNHACQPNMEIMAVVTNDGKSLYTSAFFATRDIEVGEELTFDYEGRVEPGQPRPGVKTACLCGCKKCRGEIYL